MAIETLKYPDVVQLPERPKGIIFVDTTDRFGDTEAMKASVCADSVGDGLYVMSSEVASNLKLRNPPEVALATAALIARTINNPAICGDKLFELGTELQRLAASPDVIRRMATARRCRNVTC